MFTRNLEVIARKKFRQIRPSRKEKAKIPEFLLGEILESLGN